MSRIRNWFNWYEDELKAIGTFIFAVVIVCSVFIALLVYSDAKQMQYNCNLDKRPSMYVSYWISTDSYAYDPEGFCATLKQKMENK